ncbi:phospholipase D family protein [Gelidibacter salicanalis]|uniref:Phospholipase D family protein n=1 Tax=Gelidibacter salicanalis TaxID=291193 RepID=A0A934NJ59_9FLAO|nr:phospholipase D family protein [Gelidibacter salicanalis]MBJ7882961.1 phospholipase D family protein [Gelidibacter salicanalis]
MAKFLDTQGVSYFLKQLIDDAQDKLYLISPYLQLNNQLKIALEDRAKFRLDIIMIYGKVADLNPKDSEWLENLNDIKLLFHQDLHAKCYISEKEAIVTSMNLYMYSQQNNVEMGIYVSKDDDAELYEQISKEVDKIKRGSEHRTISVQKVENHKSESLKEKSEKVIKKDKIEPIKNIDYSKSVYKSTSALSKILGVKSADLFETFEKKSWIKRDEKTWLLTKKGEEIGGQMKNSKYGEFVAWPEEIIEILK